MLLGIPALARIYIRFALQKSELPVICRRGSANDRVLEPAPPAILAGAGTGSTRDH
jgi:hypothetical protein